VQLREHFSVGIKAPNLRFDLIDVLLGVDGMCIVGGVAPDWFSFL